MCREVQSSFEAKRRARRRDAHKTIIKMTSASNHSAGEQVFTVNSQCYSSRVVQCSPIVRVDSVTSRRLFSRAQLFRVAKTVFKTVCNIFSWKARNFSWKAMT